MSSADARGFVYTLQAPMARREWTVNALQARMAAARLSRQRLEDAFKEAARNCEAEAERARSSWALSADLGGRARVLEHLVTRRNHQAGLQARIDTVQGQIKALEALLTQAQVRLSVLQEHRAGQRAQFAQARQRTDERAADAQWLTLARWKDTSPTGGAA